MTNIVSKGRTRAPFVSFAAACAAPHGFCACPVQAQIAKANFTAPVCAVCFARAAARPAANRAAAIAAAPFISLI